MFKQISSFILVKKVHGVNFNLCRSLHQPEKRRSGPKVPPSVDLSFETDKIFSVLPEVCKEVLDEQLIYHRHYPDLRERYSKLLNYTLNIDPEHVARGVILVHAYRLLEKSLLTEENLKKACVLGWCHKMMDASVLVVDDIADKATYRYNKPPWYLLEDVGENQAVLDGGFLVAGANILLANHFHTHPQFFNLQKELFLSDSYTIVGQTLEVNKYRLDEMEKYQNFQKFYTIILPLIPSALFLANIDDKDVHSVAKNICIDIAKFLKIQDDVRAVYNFYPTDGPAIATDISEGRTSWLAVEAYKRGSESQKQLLEQHYGKSNETSVNIVLDIFNELRLPEVFETYQEEFYETMNLKIQQGLPSKLPPQLFTDILNLAMSGGYRM